MTCVENTQVGHCAARRPWAKNRAGRDTPPRDRADIMKVAWRSTALRIDSRAGTSSAGRLDYFVLHRHGHTGGPPDCARTARRWRRLTGQREWAASRTFRFSRNSGHHPTGPIQHPNWLRASDERVCHPGAPSAIAGQGSHPEASFATSYLLTKPATKSAASSLRHWESHQKGAKIHWLSVSWQGWCVCSK